MKRIFSTDDVEPRDRFESWHQVICRHVIPHESLPDCPQTFSASVEAAELGDLALVSFGAGSVTCNHEKRHIGALEDELILVRQMAGELMFVQNGQTVTLRPGDMTLVETRLVYTSHLTEDARLLVAKYPRRQLIERVGRVNRFVARKLTPASGETGLLSAYMSILPAHADELQASAAQVSDQLLDLIAAGLWKSGGDEVPHLASPRALLGMQLRAAIDRHVNDHTATAESIAKSVGIGLRYANAILSDDDTSVGRLLLARRLEHCRRALADPLKLHRSISNIAYELGFTDMTHFGRRFRQAFGLLPSDYRRLVRKARQPVNS